MGSYPEFSAAFSAEVIRRDASSAQWLDDLPGLWRSLTDKWGLETVGPPRAGTTSLVVPVITRTGVRAALKLASPVVPIEAEASALSAFGGRGAVTLFEADNTRQAMLLEWVGGPALTSMADVDAAMAIAGRLSRELATATPPLGAPSLAEMAPGWLRQLRDQHEVARRSRSAMSDEHLELALLIIQHLASDDTPTLTHGDLSLANILQTSAQRWVTIDPLLLVGTAANEAHTVARSLLSVAVRVGDPARLLSAWTRRFADAAGVDRGMAQDLSFARYLASYYWESQNAGAPANVAELKQAAVSLAALV